MRKEMEELAGNWTNYQRTKYPVHAKPIWDREVQKIQCKGTPGISLSLPYLLISDFKEKTIQLVDRFLNFFLRYVVDRFLIFF